MSEAVQVRIGGRAMSTIEGSDLYRNPEGYDPGDQGARDASAGLLAASGRRSGKGWTYVVETSVAGARVIERYCRVVGETFAFESEPETRAEGRALLVVADRIRKGL